MNTYISFIDKDGININFDLNNISNDELKKTYIILFSFKELAKYHKNKFGTLSKELYEKQLLNYNIPVDEVIQELKMKYMLHDWLIETRIVCSRVKVILIIPNIKDNVDLLVDDMNKFGYYLSYLEIRIDTEKLLNNTKFYVDPNYEMGIYTK